MYVCGISRYFRGSTARANVDLDVGFKRERRARMTDFQIKAVRASSVEMYPEEMVPVARDFRATTEVGSKEKLAQMHFGGGGAGAGEPLVLSETG